VAVLFEFEFRGRMDMEESEQLSPWWGRAVAATFVLGFAVLILLTVKAYQNAPPIPDRVIDGSGATVFTGADIRAGQQVFLKYGLMDNGTIWGHGGLCSACWYGAHDRWP
jgi:nitric oxide reductase subunit B